MAAHIRSLDTRHMISTGEAGFDIQPGQTKDQCNPCADSPLADSTATDHLFLPNPYNIPRNAINGMLTFHCSYALLMQLTEGVAGYGRVRKNVRGSGKVRDFVGGWGGCRGV